MSSVAEEIRVHAQEAAFHIPSPTLYPLISDLEAESLPPPEWALDGIYPHGGLVVLFGPRGTGKTFVALGWAFGHATGHGWLGRGARQGPVVYIMGEGRGGLGVRVRAQKEFLGIEGEAGVHFITTAVPMLEPKEVHRLIRTIETLDLPPAAIVWDTLSRTFVGGDENSSRDMALYVAAIDRVKEAVGGTAIVQHHTGHNTPDRERGSSVLGGAADTIAALREKDGLITLECEKQKDASEFAPIMLEMMKIGSVGSCVFKLHGGKAEFLSAVEEKALRSLHEGFLADGASTSAWLAASGMVESSYYKARTALVRRHLVIQTGSGRSARFTPADNGLQLLKLHGSTVTP